MIKNIVGNSTRNVYTTKKTYLLPKEFHEEEIIMGETKYEVLKYIYKGKNPSSISKELKISRPTTIQHLHELRKIGLVKKGENNEGNYGDSWKSTKKGICLIEKCVGFHQVSTHNASIGKKCRGHAFIWKIKANKYLNWESILDEKKISFVRKGISKTPRIILNRKKIWLGKNYITIFEPKSKSFFSKEPTKSRNSAIYEMAETINKLKEKLGIAFDYKFTCRRQHYGFIDNPDAKYFIKRKKHILIKNEKGYWFTIDFSENKYKEGETIHQVDAVDDGVGYQNYMNSHKKTKFQVTPEFILNGFNKSNELISKVTNNQQIFDRNISLHQSVLEEIREAVSELKEEVKKLNGRK